jgi:endonuclease/exonuclease/phosphatase (EEP) superfamily protein YafD
MFRLLRSLLRTGFPLAALALHLTVVACFARRWDKATAVTVIPFWAWGGAGMLLAGVSLAVFRTRFALGILALWLVTTVVGSDETRPLLRVTAEKPREGTPSDFEGRKVLRVVSLNCRKFNPVAAEEVLAWQPDVVLLQEAPFPSQLRSLATKLAPGGRPEDHFTGGYECAILSRGKVIPLGNVGVAAMRPDLIHVMPCRIELDGRNLHAICVHLQGAVTQVGLHRRAVWEMHYHNRQSRRSEMIQARMWLEALKLSSTPIVIGGDFNAPAGDAVFRELEPDFVDAFRAAGSGWGNTYPNSTALVRIDHIYANARLKPVRARTVESVNSDHRMVIADFVEQ